MLTVALRVSLTRQPRAMPAGEILMPRPLFVREVRSREGEGRVEVDWIPALLCHHLEPRSDNCKQTQLLIITISSRRKELRVAGAASITVCSTCGANRRVTRCPAAQVDQPSHPPTTRSGTPRLPTHHVPYRRDSPPSYPRAVHCRIVHLFRIRAPE
jgi:hypothetical protein